MLLSTFGQCHPSVRLIDVTLIVGNYIPYHNATIVYYSEKGVFFWAEMNSPRLNRVIRVYAILTFPDFTNLKT